MAIVYTKHATEMLALRNIKIDLVNDCANNPDLIKPAENNRKIYFKDFGKNFLKLVISINGNNIVIITAHWLDKKRVRK